MSKPQTMTTRIGLCDVPVIRFRDLVIYTFNGGEMAADRGPYVFWTAVFKKPVSIIALGDKKRKHIIGRARVGLSAGDRFDRMRRESRAAYIPHEDRPIYAEMWEVMNGGRNVKCVRPATRDEIARWCRDHSVQTQAIRQVVVV